MSLRKKLENGMDEAFSASSNGDVKRVVHFAAAAGAAIVAIAPVGYDAWLLRIAEIIMIIKIGSYYGVTLTRGAAKGILVSSTCQLVGEAAAITSIAALDASVVATGGADTVAAVLAMQAIAVGVIEAAGHLAISSFDNPGGLSAKTMEIVEHVGAIADVNRAIDCVSGIDSDRDLSPVNENYTNTSSKSQISFCGKGTYQGYTEDQWIEKAMNASSSRIRARYLEYAKKAAEASNWD